ncbi:MAG TPA: conjugative transfer system coupling protein TraD [Rhodanobacteraceae bacterium]|nr:conjugative transfer system coupling protein TraD [Rhodanobacteraceae bacterium]
MTIPAYEDPFRPIYEIYAIVAWLTGALLLVVLSITSGLPAWPLQAAAVVSVVVGVVHSPKVRALWRRKKRMQGFPLEFIPQSQLKEQMKLAPDMVWLGKGYLWSQEEAQRAYELGRRNPDQLVPPDDEGMGRPWIHAMGDTEEDLYVPLKQLERHMLILGTTGAGKTRLLDTLIFQAVMRGEAVIILDPKGDKDLMESARAACVASGSPERFVYFHPAFPLDSARIDPLRNFNRPTELATRIANLLSSESSTDAFTQFSQMVMNNIVQGLLLVNSKPSILAIRRMIEGGLPGLVVRACEAWFQRKKPGSWESEAQTYRKMKQRCSTDEDIATAYIQLYRDRYMLDPTLASSELEGLFNSFEHDKTHASKMIASLMPLLNMLTAGELGKLLSPDATAAKDPRKITDFNRMITMRQVVYVGLDCLSDAMVGSAIGSLFLSDLATVAGDRYNYGESLEPVNLFIDEAAEIVNTPTIQLLNKGRGAKFRLCLATQTYADFTFRLGGEEKARMVLGNINNMVALQVVDLPTQEYVTENFPQTVLRRIERSQSGSAGSDADLSYGGSAGERLTEEAGPLFQPQLLGCLPTLEFFANVAGGRILKGRLPILTKGAPAAGSAA